MSTIFILDVSLSYSYPLEILNESTGIKLFYIANIGHDISFVHRDVQICALFNERDYYELLISTTAISLSYDICSSLQNQQHFTIVTNFLFTKIKSNK